jgi:hypothetical protein
MLAHTLCFESAVYDLPKCTVLYSFMGIYPYLWEFGELAQFFSQVLMTSL